MSRARVGDRVQMTGLMIEDPCPIPVGSEGKVTDVLNVGTPFEQYIVAWDDPTRSLMLLPNDPYTVVGR